MKKKESSTRTDCPVCSKLKTVWYKSQKKFQEGTKQTKKYAQKNPQKTKNILMGLGVGLATILAFLMGRKNKNKKTDSDK